MNHPIRRLALNVLAVLALPGFAAGLDPTLGQRGKLLLEEKFEGAAVPAGWTRNTGKISVTDGVMHASELASDNHIGAFRKAVPVRDCIVQLDCKFAGATMFHLGFDPEKGELKKKGHLFAVAITPDGWALNENIDKADPKSKTIVHAKAATKFEPGQWFTLMLEMKGNDVAVHVAGKPPLRANAKDFHVKKPGLVFRVGGKDAQEVLIDNLKVWELR